MRKLYLLVASCVALVAFMGFSASAFANDVYDPDCAADPDAFELTNITFDTPDTHKSWAVSGVVGTGLACGSRIDNDYALGNYPGVETLNDIAVIQNPSGVRNNAAPSAALPRGSYVGEARVDALTWIWFFGDAQTVTNSELTLRVEDRDDPITPPGALNPTWGMPDCPANSLACYRGKSDTGHGWTWVVENADGSTELTIGRFYNDVSGEPAGLTEIDYFSLCGYAGDVDGISCGDGSDSSKWLQKSGCGYERYGLVWGDPTYTVTVTNRSGAVTPAVEFNAGWWRIVAFSPKPGPSYCMIPGLPPAPARADSHGKP